MGTRSRTAAAVTGTVLAVTGCSSSAAPELAVFDRPATAEDAVPDGVGLPSTFGDTRFVADVEEARVYAARGADGRPWCIAVLVGTVEDEDWALGASCASDAEFAERGISVGVGGQVPAVEAALLPDDFDGDLQPGWEVAGPNLALPTEE